MDQNSLAVLLFLVGVGIGLPLYMAWSLRVTKTQGKLPVVRHDLTPLKLVRCDCNRDTVCPQGRDPSSGDPYRCKIWKAE